jgi:hypothetical protein
MTKHKDGNDSAENSSGHQQRPLQLVVEEMPLAHLKEHPRNYQQHPDDELDQIIASIQEHGIYRNFVVAKDNTILAGHGVVRALKKMGYTTGPGIRVPYMPDDRRALKLLIGDNEIRHLAERDDRLLTELLRSLADADDLLGTGYDEMMLANLAFVTRPSDEIADMDAASHWVGMPEYDMDDASRIAVIVNFVNDEDKQEFCRILGLEFSRIGRTGPTKSVWWPRRAEEDMQSVNFTTRARNDASRPAPTFDDEDEIDEEEDGDGEDNHA